MTGMSNPYTWVVWAIFLKLTVLIRLSYSTLTTDKVHVHWWSKVPQERLLFSNPNFTILCDSISMYNMNSITNIKKSKIFLFDRCCHEI